MRVLHYIDGQWRDSADGQRLPVLNPSDETVLAEVALGGPGEVGAAVAAAAAAQPAWARLEGVARARVLRRVADGLRAGEAQLVRLQSLNSGKPLAEARMDVADAAACFEYYAALAEGGGDTHVPLPTADYLARVRREPYGVVGLIVPWNFPMVTTAWKVAPALAAGNAVVLKPSEVTPLPELALAQIIDDAGVPAGVFNAVVGTGAGVGAALVAHPQVRKISFTGSNAVGTRIMQSAAETIKGLSLELGGKSAILVFDDADLDAACELVVSGAFMNAGQMCSATSRLLVHAPVAEALTRRVVARAKALRIGDPLAETTEMGPLASRAQLDRVLGHIGTASAEGLPRLCGGARVGDRGFYVQATVYADVPASSRLWREEVFGPVLAIQPFADEADAIARANDSEFGLVATVVTRDRQRANRVADAIEAGLVWIDMPQLIFPQTAWGGMKRSSLGRELGPWGLAAFQQIKHVVAPARLGA
jgi:betaine-aldehyde dehydrogenase